MSDVSGYVFSVERYAIHDGPGIRTQVFFKGCPLRCLWCANPEGVSFAPSLLYTRALCIECGSCVQACGRRALSMTEQGVEIDRRKCTPCSDCVNACYAEALEMDSYRVTAQEIVEQVERDKVFYGVSGGGVTLCGGEPLAQPAFALEVLRLCRKRGIHTAIETCGHYRFEVLERAISCLDFVFFDIKHMDAEAHRRCTGTDNKLILTNLKKLQSFDVDECVRVPVIPNLNDSIENAEAIASFVQGLPRVKSVELLPYHRLGVNKYKKLGLAYPLGDTRPPEKEELLKLKEVFDRHHIPCGVQI